MLRTFSRVFVVAVASLWAPMAVAQTPAATSDQAKPAAETDKPAEAPKANPASGIARKIIKVSGEAMGTRVQVMVYADPAREAEAKVAIEAAMGELNRVEKVLSEWVPDSDVSKLNKSAGGPAVELSADALAVITEGKRVNELSKGAFALTWASLASIWDFKGGSDVVHKIPTPEKALEKTGLIDDQRLEIDATKGTAKLTASGMAVGLGGIAKGYGIDRALTVLKSKGFEHALVFAGGDIVAMGSKGDTPWLVGIQDPRAQGYFATVPIVNEAVLTSGDYQNYFEQDGKRFHHLLDPRTGYPAIGSRSVTIIAKNALKADALSTAVFVLGADEGLKLIEAEPDTEAIIVTANNDIVLSTGLKDRVRIIRAPTQ